METVPADLLLANVFPFLSLKTRWKALARVSRRWRQLALESVHLDQALDLTWCTGDSELQVVTEKLFQESTTPISSRIQRISLYGPCLTSKYLCQLFAWVGQHEVRQIQLESKQISDKALGQLGVCRQLHSLSLHCIKLTNSSVILLAKSCPLLRTVDLSGCSRIRDEGIVTLANCCDFLTSLNVSMCHRLTDTSLEALANRASTSLENVVLDKCLRLSALAIRLLMVMQSQLRHLSFAHNAKVTSHEFLLLQKHHCQLRVLNVSFCGGLNDDGIVALLQHNSRFLQELNVSGLVELQPQGFDQIAECHALRALKMNMCRGLTNELIQRITHNCSRLRVLLLQGCVRLDDHGATSIAMNCADLETLSLDFCFNVTDAGFSQLVTKCTRLRDLNVKACNQLTRHAFELLVHLQHKASRVAFQTLNIGAIADFDTTLRYAELIKQAYPRCIIKWN